MTHPVFTVERNLRFSSTVLVRSKEVAKNIPRRKHRYQDPSFTIPRDVRVPPATLYVPKIGWLRTGSRSGNPYPGGEVVTAVVKRIGKRWYATLCHKKVLLPVQ